MAFPSIELAHLAAQAASDKKAEDIQIFHVGEKTDVCDYFVICTGQSTPQLEAIVDEVREKVRKNFDISPISTEGREGRRWILVDFGSVVVHVFNPETRAFYQLERLWEDVSVETVE